MSVMGSQNFGWHGVGVVSPENFAMGRKAGLGQKKVLRSVPAHYIERVPYTHFFRS